VDYTNCLKNGRDPGSNATCAAEIRNNLGNALTSPCRCEVSFNLDKDFSGDVFMYYGLTNFYQNHRRYVKSRDDNQLLGELSQTVSSDCSPFDRDVNGKPIVPCGAIANSLFNDTLKLKSVSFGNIPVSRTGIAWPSDKGNKFNNPPGDLQKGKEIVKVKLLVHLIKKILFSVLEKFGRPIAWTRNLWELDSENPDNNGLKNEDLIVWMRTAALPSFRKLYRRVDFSKQASLGGKLPRGQYVLEIDYSECQSL
jgi:LEM3 (ligand-effect modulator 3) family / CDC50 family